MNEVMEGILQNRMLMSAVAAWAIAQVIKTILFFAVNKKLDISRLTGDGGMPSGHSATVTALAVTAYLEHGVGSGLFALAAMFAIVTMHDAMGVRRESGKHAKAINELLEMFDSDIQPDEKLKEFIGHTPFQVVVGAILGFCVALASGQFYC